MRCVWVLEGAWIRGYVCELMAACLLIENVGELMRTLCSAGMLLHRLHALQAVWSA